MSEFSDVLVRRLAELERRVAGMERQSQLGHSSVTDEYGNTVNAAAGIMAGATASTDAALALEQIVDVAAVADGKVTVFYSDTAPTEADDDPEYNDQWLLTAPATYAGVPYAAGTLLRYDGDTWLLTSQSAAAALAAAQSAQTTADGKIETFWQESNPGPGSEGDIWYRIAPLEPGETVPRILGMSRWSSGAWIPLPLAGDAIAQGALDPDRFTVGVTGNLLNDPQLLTALRTPPNLFTINPPDANPSPAPGSNWVRVAGSSVDRPYVPGGGGQASSFPLTEPIPVDQGRTVRFAAWYRVSSAVLSQGAPNALVRLRLVFYAPDGSALSSGVQLVQVDAVTEGVAADTWTPIEGRFMVPESYTTVVAMLQTNSQRAGNVDFIAPELQVLWDRVQSSDYDEGDAGWALNADTVQFPNANVLGSLGAADLSATRLNLNGQDVELELVGPLPLGIVAFDARGSATTGIATAATVGTTEVLWFTFNMGPQSAGRLYKFHLHGHLAGTTAGDAFDIRIRYTQNGTEPTVSSALLRLFRVSMPTTPSLHIQLDKLFTSSSSFDNVRFAICIARAAGTGSATMYMIDSARNLTVYVEDMGLYGAAALAGALAQKSYQDATPADPAPVNTYTRTWPATWTRSYDGDLGTRNGDDTPDLYQGYLSSTHGNTRSLIGFDYAAIQAALSGATIQSIRLVYRVKHASGGAGITFVLSSHNYTSKPAAWAAANVAVARLGFYGQKEGATYTQTLPTYIGNEFKSGTTRGLGFGPGTSNDPALYYGYVYSDVKLVITYTK